MQKGAPIHMSLNPMSLMKLKPLWECSTNAHPKFFKFWKAVYKTSLAEGTVIEFKVTAPDGRELASNIKLTKDDLDFAALLKELLS